MHWRSGYAQRRPPRLQWRRRGVYWMPVWNVLEPYGLQLLLINPEHYKAVRGKRTDLKDGTRIAELLQDGRLEGSYVPPVDIRVLRDLTRYRIKLVQYQSSIANRIQKLLEQCNIKLWRPWPATPWASVRWPCCALWPREKRMRALDRAAQSSSREIEKAASRQTAPLVRGSAH